MELSEIAKNLWAYYRLDWEEDPQLRDEKEAIVAVNGKLDELRAIQYWALPGQPLMRSLYYVEKDRGSIQLITSQGKPAHFGCEAMPAYHKAMKQRLQESSPLGFALTAAQSMLTTDTHRRQRTMRNMLVPDLKYAAETFIRYIDAHQAYVLQPHR